MRCARKDCASGDAMGRYKVQILVPAMGCPFRNPYIVTVSLDPIVVCDACRKVIRQEGAKQWINAELEAQTNGYLMSQRKAICDFKRARLSFEQVN